MGRPAVTSSHGRVGARGQAASARTVIQRCTEVGEHRLVRMGDGRVGAHLRDGIPAPSGAHDCAIAHGVPDRLARVVFSQLSGVGESTQALKSFDH